MPETNRVSRKLDSQQTSTEHFNPSLSLSPKRIQRKRTKGWRMPPNTVYVGRPTRWGNPYPMEEERRRQIVVAMYEDWLRHKLEDDPQFLDELKGKDLACWCPLDKLCHADVLLKFLKESP